ncbi:MAG: hypothetical protein J0I14_01795 [Propionibacteriaceae bacterium]|jgi:hypothetical protein|nr:hypothetical protein [Propionibacteriaceae bacterium]
MPKIMATWATPRKRTMNVACHFIVLVESVPMMPSSTRVMPTSGMVPER